VLYFFFVFAACIKKNSRGAMKRRTYIEKRMGTEWLLLEMVSRQKSELKKLFQERKGLSEAFLVGDLPYSDSLGKGIEDSSYTLISFSGRQEHATEEEPLTGKSVMQFMVNHANEFFSLPNSHTYVLAFDKRQYVPENKREKQLLHSLNDSKDVEPLDWDPEQYEHVLEWDKEIEFNWESLKTNRVARAQAMRDVVDMLKHYYRPPAGKRLIVDSDTYKHPLVITTDLVGSCTEAYLDQRLHNRVGEGDNSIMCYVDWFSHGEADVEAHRGSDMDRPCWNGEDTDDILVRSKDTDVWLTLMLLYERRHMEGDFINRVIVCSGVTNVTATEGSKSVLESTCGLPQLGASADPFIAAMMTDESPMVIHCSVSVAPPKSQRVSDSEQLISRVGSYIDINRLFDSTATKLMCRDGTVLPRGLESLFVVCIMGGNDYVDGYYGLSYDALLKTWFQFYEDIGCLVEFNNIGGRQLISITPSHYLRLLIRAYYQAYEKRSITDPEKYPTKRVPKPNFPPGAPGNLTLDTLSTIVRQLKARYENRWVPSCDDIGCRMRRTEWYLRYCYYGYLSDPSTHVPDPIHHGWEPSRIRYCTYLGRTGELDMLTRKVTLCKRRKL